MKKGFKILLIVLVALISAAILSRMAFREGEPQKHAYKLAKVQRGNIVAIVASTGTVNPLNTVQIGSQVSGNVKEIFADFNSSVKKGQVLATIDPAVYAAQLEQAKAQLWRAKTQLLEASKDIEMARVGILSAEANIDSARASLRQAETQHDRLAQLIKNKTVSKSEYDTILTRRDNARGDLKMAAAKLATAKAQLARAIANEKGARALIAERQATLKLARVKLQYCTIISPIDGVVISRAVDVGQTVAATLQSPVLFTIAEDLTRVQVEVDVSEADVGQIKPDQVMQFSVDAFPDKKFKALVRQIRNYPTNIQNVITYKLIADLRNEELLLRPGMTANATIVVAREDGALKVPNAALRFRPLGQAKEPAKAQPRVPKDSPLYKKTVKNLNLDSKQAEDFEQIIAAAGSKLKATLQTAQDDQERAAAMRTFFTQVFKKLRTILREDQLPQYYEFVQKIKQTREKRKTGGGQAGQVYVLDERGLPMLKQIWVGISNETESQIIRGDLDEGDAVIVGLALPMQGSRKSSPLDFLSKMFRWR